MSTPTTPDQVDNQSGNSNNELTNSNNIIVDEVANEPLPHTQTDEENENEVAHHGDNDNSNTNNNDDHDNNETNNVSINNNRDSNNTLEHEIEEENWQELLEELSEITRQEHERYSPEAIASMHRIQGLEMLKREIENSTSALVCAQCKHPLAAYYDILSSRTEDAWKDQVYCYQMELFTNEEQTWVYSATNPNSFRFDVVRVSPFVNGTMMDEDYISHRIKQEERVLTEEMNKMKRQQEEEEKERVAEKMIDKNNNNICNSNADDNKSSNNTSELEVNKCNTATSANVNVERWENDHVNNNTSFVFTKGSYSSEHSFFIGYDWCFCHCINCGSFVGWGFAKHERVVEAMKQAELAEKEQEEELKKEKEKKKKTEKLKHSKKNEKNKKENQMERKEEERANAEAAADAMRREDMNNSNTPNSFTENGSYNTLQRQEQQQQEEEEQELLLTEEHQNVEEDEHEHSEQMHSARSSTSSYSRDDDEENEMESAEENVLSQHISNNVNNVNEDEEWEDEDDIEDDDEDEDDNDKQRGEEIPSSISDKRQVLENEMSKIAQQRKTFHTTPTPDFIGLIITRCTAETFASANMLHHLLERAEETLIKCHLLSYFDKQIRTLVDRSQASYDKYFMFTVFKNFENAFSLTWMIIPKYFIEQQQELITQEGEVQETSNRNTEVTNVINNQTETNNTANIVEQTTDNNSNLSEHAPQDEVNTATRTPEVAAVTTSTTATTPSTTKYDQLILDEYKRYCEELKNTLELYNQYGNDNNNTNNNDSNYRSRAEIIQKGVTLLINVLCNMFVIYANHLEELERQAMSERIEQRRAFIMAQIANISSDDDEEEDEIDENAEIENQPNVMEFLQRLLNETVESNNEGEGRIVEPFETFPDHPHSGESQTNAEELPEEHENAIVANHISSQSNDDENTNTAITEEDTSESESAYIDFS